MRHLAQLHYGLEVIQISNIPTNVCIFTIPDPFIMSLIFICIVHGSSQQQQQSYDDTGYTDAHSPLSTELQDAKYTTNIPANL